MLATALQHTRIHTSHITRCHTLSHMMTTHILTYSHNFTKLILEITSLTRGSQLTGHTLFKRDEFAQTHTHNCKSYMNNRYNAGISSSCRYNGSGTGRVNYNPDNHQLAPHMPISASHNLTSHKKYELLALAWERNIRSRQMTTSIPGQTLAYKH